jgi:hypothetical protein
MEEKVNASKSTKQDGNGLASRVILTNSNVSLSNEIKEQIAEKIEDLKKSKKLKRVFAIVVKGEEDDEKPLYIGYFKRPSLSSFSAWLNFVQKDTVQANKMLAQDTFIEGDRDLIDDDDLFLFGCMAQLTSIAESRNADLVKVASVAK